ncbi:MAG: hypothetical protein AB1499_13855 [Nitrospirota bacterium]
MQRRVIPILTVELGENALSLVGVCTELAPTPTAILKKEDAIHIMKTVAPRADGRRPGSNATPTWIVVLELTASK